MHLNGTKTLVVGMKKSGMASAELLARQGAPVRATDLKPLDELPGSARSCWSDWAFPSRGRRREVFEGCDLIVLSPDVPADLPPLEAARARGVARDRRGGTGRAVPARPHHRHHGVQRQDHHHQPGGPHPARSRRAGAGGRQHRNARDRHGGELPRGWLERAGAFQFSTRDHLRVPGAYRRWP